jgi:hypothetical protein
MHRQEGGYERNDLHFDNIAANSGGTARRLWDKPRWTPSNTDTYAQADTDSHAYTATVCPAEDHLAVPARCNG